MQSDVSVTALCLKLGQKLVKAWNNELTLERHKKVLAEFIVLQIATIAANRLTLTFSLPGS